HPIVLMTSRQCLHQQVTGCEKDRMDDDCLPHCGKSASITNMKMEKFYIEKTNGNYHRIYNETNFLNTAIVTDLPDLYAGFLVDLSDLKTETKTEINKPGVIKLFENLLSGDPGSEKELRQVIHPTTDNQYYKGI
ncbi:MAG: U32 family peptidase, partial [Mariniphaga sp.]|nr:U32 family peptidase [Mariniphaga sp.]